MSFLNRFKIGANKQPHSPAVPPSLSRYTAKPVAPRGAGATPAANAGERAEPIEVSEADLRPTSPHNHTDNGDWIDVDVAAHAAPDSDPEVLAEAEAEFVDVGSPLGAHDDALPKEPVTEGVEAADSNTYTPAEESAAPVTGEPEPDDAVEAQAPMADGSTSRKATGDDWNAAAQNGASNDQQDSDYAQSGASRSLVPGPRVEQPEQPHGKVPARGTKPGEVEEFHEYDPGTDLSRFVRTPGGKQRKYIEFDEASIIDRVADAVGLHIRGLVHGLVAQSMQASLCVLDVRCGRVVLAGTAEALASSHAISIRNTLRHTWHFEIWEADVELPASGVRLLVYRLEREEGHGSYEPITFDTRFLQFYDDFFRVAVVARASDIHISTDRQGIAKISFRIFGRKRPWLKCSSVLLLGSLGAAFGKRIKEKTTTKEQFSSEVPVAFMTTQLLRMGADGSNEQIWEGRVNGRPTIGGYKTVIRLLHSSPAIEDIPTLSGLGWTPSHIDTITPVILKNYGIVIMFGSVGSGKSTTLRTFMTVMTDTDHMDVISVESPVEYEMPGVNQISIPVDTTLTSEAISQKMLSVLRDAMRMDPDVLMVGEVRDRETAELMVQFADTDNRCYTTSHGGGAVDGLARITEGVIGIDPKALSRSKMLTASIYQKLIPLLCPHCKQSATRSEFALPDSKQEILRKKFGLDPRTMYVAKPGGCSKCSSKIVGLMSDGTDGATACVEIFVPDAGTREHMRNRDWHALMRTWRGGRRTGFGEPDMRGKTAFEHGLYELMQGRISLHDLESNFEPIDAYEIYPDVNGKVTP